MSENQNITNNASESLQTDFTELDGTTIHEDNKTAIQPHILIPQPHTDATIGENIPSNLRGHARFCCWQYEYVNARWTKVPYNPATGRRAKSTDPETFSDFTTAMEAQKDYDGVGLGIFGNIGAIDIDHCINDGGVINPVAMDIVETMDTYTEISPSGHGIRILFIVPEGFRYDKAKYFIHNQQSQIEVYIAGSTNKYVTITGKTFDQDRKAIRERGKQLQTVANKYMIRPTDDTKTEGSFTPDLTDREIIDKAIDSSSKFKALWNGDTTGYPSDSEADLALCEILAFWTQRDAARIDNLFRQSALMRDKWKRDDYRNGTITKAINLCSEVYTPQQMTPEDRKTETKDQSNGETPAATFTAVSVSDYLKSGQFEDDINYFKRYKDRKTGFSNLQDYLTLYPGLATLGGTASVGKTTFCVQLSNNLVKAGETVLYFAFEQSAVEIVTKSLASRMYEHDPLTPLDNTEIKGGGTSAALEAVKRDYASESDRFIIVRCNFMTSADEITDYVQSFIRSTGIRPVVFIDYLQLVSPPEGFRGDTRAATDYTVKKLKTLQIDNELLVFMISNFNRSGYETPASYEDFKESGQIEYCSDYVFELTLAIMETERFFTKTGSKGGKSDTSKKAKYDMTSKANKENPKKVAFVSLKNRNGKQSFKAFFDYYMQFDYFRPLDGNPYGEDDEDPAEADSDFVYMGEDDEDPFDDIDFTFD